MTRSLASTGGTIKMTRDVLEHGFMWAGQLAGGTHHAFAGHGEGFCVFNDIACAVKVAQRDYEELFEGEDRNVLIVDLDVHQGNGTAKIFENDKNIITYSIHGDRNYPWKTRMLSDYDHRVTGRLRRRGVFERVGNVATESVREAQTFFGVLSSRSGRFESGFVWKIEHDPRRVEAAQQFSSRVVR